MFSSVLKRLGNPEPNGSEKVIPMLAGGRNSITLPLTMKRIFSLLLAPFAFLLPPMSAKEPLDIGAEAPSVEAINQDGETVCLEELYKEGDVLVYFYPRADTPGCTAQACSLRDDFEALSDRDVIVVGVSADDVETQKAFQEKYELPFVLLADTERKVIEAFGVPTRGTFATRQTFLVRAGKIVWRDLSASTAKQAADVLQALASLDE